MGDATSIERAQFVTRKNYSALPPHLKIETDSYPIRQSAIDFMKSFSKAFPEEAAESNEHIKAIWYQHETECDDSYVIYSFHGGAYVLGSAEIEMPLLYGLAKKSRSRIFSVNYRLAPQYRFPCAVIDALSGYMHLLDKGIEPSRIVLHGCSAGGGLTMSLLLAIRELGLPMPAGAYLMCAWLDLTHSFPSFTDNADTDFLPDGSPENHHRLENQKHFYAPDSELKNPYVSPIFATSFKMMPPILAQTGTVERLFDENVALASRLAKESDTFVRLETYKDQVHTFQAFTFLPTSSKAFDMAVDFIKTVTDRLPSSQKVSTRTDFGHDGECIDERLFAKL